MGHGVNPRQSGSCSNLGATLAHELGHLLYLPHDERGGLLMQWKGKGTKIPKGTEMLARENYKKYLEQYLEQ